MQVGLLFGDYDDEKLLNSSRRNNFCQRHSVVCAWAPRSTDCGVTTCATHMTRPANFLITFRRETGADQVQEGVIKSKLVEPFYVLHCSRYVRPYLPRMHDVWHCSCSSYRCLATCRDFLQKCDIELPTYRTVQHVGDAGTYESLLLLREKLPT